MKKQRKKYASIARIKINLPREAVGGIKNIGCCQLEINDCET
jgi:hypothetical protein